MLNVNELAIPKKIYERSYVIDLAGTITGETPQDWLVPCHHIVNPPAAPGQITRIKEVLKLEVPIQLRQFLELSNGAKLYSLLGSSIARYELFNTDEIINVNAELWENFRGLLGNDRDFKDVSRLNYLAFCDALDGNYIAIILDGPHQGEIFFLLHELCYRPFSEDDLEFYPIIASSFANWLKLLIETKGSGGFGPTFVPW